MFEKEVILALEAQGNINLAQKPLSLTSKKRGKKTINFPHTTIIPPSNTNYRQKSGEGS